MSRRRRRVKIKSSSRLFAFILFNLLLLASCITAHYQPRPQSDKLEVLAALGPPALPSTPSLPPPPPSSTLLLEPPTQFNIPAPNTQNSKQFQPKPSQNYQAPSSIAQLQTSQLQPQPPHSLFGDQDFEAERSNNQQLQLQQHPNRDNGAATATTTSTAATPTTATSIPSIASLCAMLPPAHARHLKLCRLASHSPNADEAVAVGAARGLAECRQQFRSERWNCTHAAGDHHLLTSKLAQSVGNREGGFVQAIAAAGIVHSIATACSTGSLNDCACDKTRVGPIRQRDQNWKWGGCSNNIRHGMMYARHLVELLDAVHEHHHHHHMQRSLGANQRHHNHQLQLQQHGPHQLSMARCHQLMTRSLGSANLRPQQQQQQDQQLPMNFCQKNQNISQTIHIQLIKSLLAKNSLERHQDFRLAMNAHNNRVGRMAVAKNMEIKCRCHGLSGSCSLKTCWLKLPDFQQIGAHLKRKYEGSVHLPTAINVNKLIPMMDRNEISAILLQQQQQQQVTPMANEPSSATESSNSLRAAISAPAVQQTGPQPQPEFAAWSSEAPATQHVPQQQQPPPQQPPSQPARLNYYERHKQLEQRFGATPAGPSTGSNRLSAGSSSPMSQTILANPNGNQMSSNLTSLYLHGDEIPVQIAPMSQQQYQALLREMKLCNSSQVVTATVTTSTTSTTTTTTRTSRLNTKRDLQQLNSESSSLASQCYQKVAQQSAGRKFSLSAAANEIGAGRSPAAGGPSAGGLSRPPSAGQQLQLSHLLQVNNRDELVHLHKSPDYCEPDLRHGFAGVQARLCNQDPLAPDSCDRLCCGRGFERRELELRYNCDCKFQYCCKIHCNVCQKTLVEYVCK